MIRSTRNRPRCHRWEWLLLVIIAIAGCDESPSSRPPTTRPATQRVISLSPGITQMIIDLGKGETIVGVGTYDPVAPSEAKVVGDLHTGLNYERLMTLAPTDVFVQPLAAGVPGRLTELAGEEGWRVHTYRFEVIADVTRALRDDPANPDRMAIGEALGVPAAGKALLDRIETQLAALSQATKGQPKPRTLLLFGTSPLTAIGPKTFLDELLTVAGGENVLADALVPYPQLDREKLHVLKPDVIFVLQGSDATGEWVVPSILAEADIPAARNGQIHRMAGATILLPSSHLADTAVQLARLLHPELAATFDAIASRHDQP